MASWQKFTDPTRKSWTGLGIMSGTSLDGIDLCVVSFTKEGGVWNYVIKHAVTREYTTEIENVLKSAHNLSGFDLIKAHLRYGRYLGETIRDFLTDCQTEVDFVGCHGHTIFHQPDDHVTFQLGDGETMASYMYCPLVNNFRTKDVALGGQGAPLVPLAEQHLFADFDFCLNLGGIANISIRDEAQGFDVGPCNLLLNHFASAHDSSLKFDKNGEIAETGTVIDELLSSWNALPFFKLVPPKSTGREWLEDEVIPLAQNKGYSTHNILATACRLIAAQIGEILTSTSTSTNPRRMLITGGGAFNRHLMSCIKIEIQRRNLNITMVTVSRETVEFKEALSFAFLGLLSLKGEVNVNKLTTGARCNSVSGSIHMPTCA
ncbi:hypothetical protein CAPTEDRAFT_207028 [Capitella teleta]|uniref:Anhydro-N-acetylmuramic acid kinase n=1 Tax=Capitella teleta TaxID=283909 RepID=R7URX5_CAPTE|nr:hypothetical protein CAPTEDRAFT_207028 [Capitella teleta]|eukprot:ELU08950.1 hypothetical protein CAPTEDRAFT_207028 [Capitella teleta]